MRVVECEQGSAEWLASRVGLITASRVGELLSKYKSDKKAGAETAERYNYKIDVIVERLTGRSTENFVSPEMIWGRENEDDARTAYEIDQAVMTEKVGFILHPKYDWAGASPDSLVRLDGGLEIKAPKSATHLKWMREGVVPEEHRPQMLLNMVCAERAWWDFASYDPRMPAGLRLFTARLEFDPIRAAELEAEAVKFNDEIDAVLAELGKRVIKEQPRSASSPVETSPPVENWAKEFEMLSMSEKLEFAKELIP